MLQFMRVVYGLLSILAPKVWSQIKYSLHYPVLAQVLMLNCCYFVHLETQQQRMSDNRLQQCIKNTKCFLLK